jgi:hypothetical protein
MNFSSWDSIPSPKKQNPAFSPAHLIVEFERTKKQKIFQHKLGRVDFSRERDINQSRQDIINREIGNLSPNGFKYKNVGHVYTPPTFTLQSSGPEDFPRFPIYAHGHPLGGTEYGGMESCSRMGLECAEGEGSDGFCSPGKCVIGFLERIKDTKWKYESANVYGPDGLPAMYYVPAKESIVLKPILRGSFVTYGEDNAPVTIGINNPASIPTRIYLPPKFYYSDDFIESLLILTDERLGEVLNPPTSKVVGVEQRKERFIRSIALLAYPGASDGVISNQLNGIATEALRDTLIATFEKAPGPWPKQCNLAIEEEFLFRFIKQYSGVKFVSAVYDRIYELFSGIAQITESSLSQPRISYDKERIARPIYSRLPGITEAYRSDPAFSDKETPAQWLTSGSDDYLSKKKDSIDRFYENYLDPETCSPAILDWLAQHVGLTGELWNTRWDRKIKEAMIENALGWWDKQIFDDLRNLTPKGSAVYKYPFTEKSWVFDDTDYKWGGKDGWESALSSWGGNKYNLHLLKLDEIGQIKITNSGKPESTAQIKYKAFDTASQKALVLSTDIPKINKLLWNGLIEAKGSLLGVMFLVSLFSLKSHVPEELEVVDLERKILKPKSGLRNSEIFAPPLLPYKPEVIQVGVESDAQINNYTNQLIAGVSRVSSVKESRNVFFRVPYYYNRNGKSWDRTTYIARSWMPGHLNVRVQYPYLSADLWAVGDGFFEPDIITE